MDKNKYTRNSKLITIRLETKNLLDRIKLCSDETYDSVIKRIIFKFGFVGDQLKQERILESTGKENEN